MGLDYQRKIFSDQIVLILVLILQHGFAKEICILSDGVDGSKMISGCLQNPDDVFQPNPENFEESALGPNYLESQSHVIERRAFNRPGSEQLLTRVMKKSNSESSDEIAKKSAPEFFIRSLKSFGPNPQSMDRYRRFGNDYLARSLRSYGGGEFLARAMRGAGDDFLSRAMRSPNLFRYLQVRSPPIIHNNYLARAM